MSTWTSDDLFFLEAAYTSGMTLPATAQMLRRPEEEVRQKAAEQGFIESPTIVPEVGEQVDIGKAASQHNRS